MNTDFLELDGAIGGGQILRSALSLSMITGRPMRIRNIRKQRGRPGLLRQHLTAVQAAAQICGARTQGVELGSMELTFIPGAIRGGDYRFAIGSAGSCTLVLQTLLPALLFADSPARLWISGGTHNPLAPPADFIEHAWLPLLRRMGAQVEMKLLRHGFMPAGGGEVMLQVQPGELRPLALPARGEVREQEATAVLANIPHHVGERELRQVAMRLGWPEETLKRAYLAPGMGPGNALLLKVGCDAVTELFCALGQTRLSAERVADLAIRPLQAWLTSGAATSEYLADQLLLPMALAGGGQFSTCVLSDHLTSNIEVIQQFLPVRCLIQSEREDFHNVTLTAS